MRTSLAVMALIYGASAISVYSSLTVAAGAGASKPCTTLCGLSADDQKACLKKHKKSDKKAMKKKSKKQPTKALRKDFEKKWSKSDAGKEFTAMYEGLKNEKCEVLVTKAVKVS